MTVNINARADIYAVESLHGAVTDFGAFLQAIRDNTAGDVSALIQVPARVTSLLAQKASFDALGLSATRIEEIMTKNMGYSDWASASADFAAIFTSAANIRTAVLNNIGSLVQIFNGNAYQLTVSGALKTSLESVLDGILAYYS